MIPGIDPKVDYAFKKVFGSEANIPLLRSLLEAVLNPPPDQRIAALEICNPFNDKETLDDKLSILDIKVRDQRGQQYNVEMQMTGSLVYPQRVLYYWSKLYAQQLREGDDYKRLQATISISFLDGVLFPNTPDYHLDFQVRSSRHAGLIFCPHLAIHLVELPKFRLKAEELIDPLELWTYFLIHGGELDKDNLPPSLRETQVRQAMEVLTMMTQSELERDRYEARLKAWRDERMRLDELEEGRRAVAAARRDAAEGVKKGEIIGRIHICQRLLKLALTPTDELSLKTPEELEAAAASLEQKLGLVP